MIYDQQPETVVVAPSGGGSEQLIYTALLNEALSAPIISPDNQWVAFTKGSTGSDLMVVSVAPPHLPIRATPGRQQVSGLGPSRYAFSPDSRSIAVTGDLAVSGRLDLRVFSLTTQLETILISASEVVAGGGVREIGWSNPGTLLARASLLATPSQTHQIVTCAVAGPCSLLPGDPGNGVTTVGAMAVAPDGAFLVYTGNQRTGFVDLYRISTLGGLSTRIVQSPTQAGRIGNSSLVISRDSQRVAFVADFANPMSFFDVYVIPAAGATAVQPLVVATASQAIDTLEFSPTATSLAFRLRMAATGPYGAFRTVNLTTPGQSPVLLQASPVVDLRWSP
ncbi:MAG: hypothetical protein IAE78_28140 [Myxococcus sp.]|nr:hypothetical protein [Myxococcus sp.]